VNYSKYHWRAFSLYIFGYQSWQLMKKNANVVGDYIRVISLYRTWCGMWLLQIVAHIFDQLRKWRIVGRVQARPYSSLYWCLQTLLRWWIHTSHWSTLSLRIQLRLSVTVGYTWTPTCRWTRTCQFLIIGLKQQLSKIDHSLLNSANSARNLGFNFDEHLIPSLIWSHHFLSSAWLLLATTTRTMFCMNSYRPYQ